MRLAYVYNVISEERGSSGSDIGWGSPYWWVEWVDGPPLFSLSSLFRFPFQHGKKQEKKRKEKDIYYWFSNLEQISVASSISKSVKCCRTIKPLRLSSKNVQIAQAPIKMMTIIAIVDPRNLLHPHQLLLSYPPIQTIVGEKKKKLKIPTLK